MIDKRDKKFKEIIKEIADAISGSELENHVYAVGGCVRDEYCDEPIKDIDLAVDLPNGGFLLATYLKEKDMLLGGDFVFFEAYSVCNFTLRSHPKMEIEAVQTRKEKYEDKKSRNPVTAFGSIYEDCYRRDLTINSLYKNVSTGELLDITGLGIHDLDYCIIRTPLNPEETFDDDPLRMMRVIRFATRFDFEIDENVLAAIRKMASRLSIVSRERIHDEFIKMLIKNPHPSVKLLSELGLMKIMFGKYAEFFDTERLNYESLLERVNFTNLDSVNERIAYLLLRIVYNKDEEFVEIVKELLNYMKFSNNGIKNISVMIDNVLRWMKDKPLEDGNIKHSWFFKECYRVHDRKLMEMSVNVFHTYVEDKDDYKVSNILNVYMNYVADGLMPDFSVYVLPVTGEEIMEKFGINPGPEVRFIKEKMLEYVFENPDASKEEILRNVTI